MPYIKNNRRKVLAKAVDDVKNSFVYLNNFGDGAVPGETENPLCPGDLNYLITAIVHSYIETKGMNYQSFNDVMGALNGVNLELYRTVIGPYEEVKRMQNGRISSIEG